MAIREKLVTTGDRMPSLVFRTLDGEELALDGFRGKRFIVYLWASW